MPDRTPLSEYTDEELIAEVLRRELKLSDFGIALMKDDDKMLQQIREAMARPWERPKRVSETT